MTFSNGVVISFLIPENWQDYLMKK